MNAFAQWLYSSQSSLVVRTHDWVVPTIQTIHILAMCVVFSSVFVTCLKALGVVERDQNPLATVQRFGPWFWRGLGVMAVTGIVLILGEPARELLSLSFWLKMLLLAAGAIIAALFEFSLRRADSSREVASVMRPAARTLVFLSLFIWVAVTVLGRFIAWDGLIWGSLPTTLLGTY